MQPLRLFFSSTREFFLYHVFSGGFVIFFMLNVDMMVYPFPNLFDVSSRHRAPSRSTC